MNIDIRKELKEKAGVIDRIIERYIPKKYDENSLEFTLGKPRYKYEVDSINHSIADPLWDILDRGGKRWRPALFLLVCEALGGDPEKYKDLAIIPEIIHNGTLMVDDVEDDSDIRRGKPCIHKIYGNDIAINAGNTMYFLPLLVLLKNKEKYTREMIIKAYEIITQEMIKVSFGQAMDIAWHKDIASDISEDEYLQMCTLKTGTLARMAAKLGALVAGADDEKIERVGKLAETIGVAFQIQDDILNLIGEKKYGKEIGGDITEGKRTLIVIHTLEKADTRDKKRLLEILKMHSHDTRIINEAIDIIKKYDSINYAKQSARKMVRECWNEVDKILSDTTAKDKIKAFAEYLVERDI